MKICVAALCDFAQVRESLLTVASAGITRVWRPQYPAPMGLMLALVIEVAPAEAALPREIRIRVEDSDGKRLAESSGGFQVDVPPEGNDPGEVLMLPFAIDFRGVELPAAGRYQVVVDLMTEDIKESVLAFRAGFPSEAGHQ